MPEGIGYGIMKVKVPNTSASAKTIPPKGLPTVSNGAPYRTGRPRIPENAVKPDRGAAVAKGPWSGRGAQATAPKRASNAPMKTEKKPSLGGQRMRESGKGFSKLKGGR